MPLEYFKKVINNVVLNDIYQTIIFHPQHFSWQREQSAVFMSNFFKLTKSITQIEVIEGADRMSMRFYYHQEEFVLNIESTCEAIWIESYAGSQTVYYNELYQEIKSLIA